MLTPGKIYLFTPDEETEKKAKAILEPVSGLLHRLANLLSKVCK